MNELNIDRIEFPVLPSQMKIFEKLNTNISVNIYVLQKKNVKYIVAPIRVIEQKKTNHVNLLLLQSYYVDEDKDEDDVVDPDVTPEPMRFHYVWIKDLSRTHQTLQCNTYI